MTVCCNPRNENEPPLLNRRLGFRYAKTFTKVSLIVLICFCQKYENICVLECFYSCVLRQRHYKEINRVLITIVLL